MSKAELLDAPPPRDLECEAAVIASILLWPGKFPQVAATLSSHDFWDEMNRAIFAAMLRLHKRGVPPVAALVLGKLQDSNSGISAGTLIKFFRLYPLACYLPHYCNRVKEMAARRSRIDQGIESIQLGGKAPTPRRRIA